MIKNGTIAIQGLKGSFHHEAAQYFFGSNIQLLECETFDQVIEATQETRCHYGIMAIENSLAGSIIPNYNRLRLSGLKIYGEVGIRVKLNLLALSGASIDDITEVRSHQMALRQCSPFFKTMPHIKIVETFDTAGSAKEIAEYRIGNVGAVASLLAAKEYGLNVVKEGIESHELNYTRFLILGKPGHPVELPNKASIYFEAKDAPGSLAQLLSVISGLGINLSKLQSHPIPSKNTHYGFFATLDLKDTDQLKNLEILLQAMTVKYDILGVYKKGETHG